MNHRGVVFKTSARPCTMAVDGVKPQTDRVLQLLWSVRGNFAALARFRGRIRQIWFNALMRRNQKSKRWKVRHLVDEVFVLAKPRITPPEGWLTLMPGYLAGRAGASQRRTSGSVRVKFSHE